MSLLYTDNEWTFEKLRVVDEAIKEIAVEELHLDFYPNQIEVISSDQMLDAYTHAGLPMMYTHWSFGKRFLKDQYYYRKGYNGLAYELVINSSPCIAFLMEENSMTMQTLVIAHACYGHNHFFKNNYLIRQWTDAEAIIDYISFAKNYIQECEERYGIEEVEATLDACHALEFYGVDRYKRPQKLSKSKEIERQKERLAYLESQVSELWKTIPHKNSTSVDSEEEDKPFPSEPQENLLYFIEKYSPVLKPWQREIVRIVRKIGQYFWPNIQTKLTNEGFATFTHYYIMDRLWEKGMISEGNYLEFLHSHSSVVNQLPYNHKYYNGYNPYALGFDLFKEIRRLCTEPTKEDEERYPNVVGKNWVEMCLDAVENFKDESFIAQYLTPNLIRKWKMFELTNKEEAEDYLITGIQGDSWYDQIRRSLSRHYAVGSFMPDIQIVDSNLKGSRELKLRYTPYKNRKLLPHAERVVDYIHYLWGYKVTLSRSTDDSLIASSV